MLSLSHKGDHKVRKTIRLTLEGVTEVREVMNKA